ncbi:uncharacterized protein LOC133795722 [Humulus lupulus]|uniref:uncharacterized protein LOC133795722 n=1 Tax=Humulus lupulus TaxID=3486 RepID=UPI002B405F4C|nr:uncharacterized protein LOC133795722 [Humulus lupulus]
MGFEGCFVVDYVGHSGGIAMLWKVGEEASLLSYGQNYVDMEVSLSGHPKFRLTGFYGEPNRSLRVESWSKIRQLARVSSLPWCLLGDLNNVLSNNDKRGGRPYPSWLINGFQETISDCSLIDMDLVGHRLLGREGVEQIIGWRDPLCRQIVQDWWGVPFSDTLAQKIRCCSTSLAEWGRNITGRFKQRIARLKAILQRTQGRRDMYSLQKYKEAESLLFEVLSQQEVFWRQRSKQFWLQAGDLNTKFFHASANKRRRRNQVVALKDDDGVLRDWDSGLDRVMVDYFKQLFSTSTTDWCVVTECISATVSDEVNLDLVRPIESDEVRKALFQMHPDKSPGPDGFSPGFYQKFWDIVGVDIISMVQDFFTTGMFPDHLSETNIVLIPKKSNPESMGDLRPIALCNVVYKVVSKVMANRMKDVLNVVISETQSAFVPGRLITDNIMVAFEVMHYLKRKVSGKDGFMALKLDMSKAYDRIEWGFLEAMMKKMGFGDHWVSLVMKCVSSVAYKIAIEGQELGPIVPTRGLRQGDPLSPYLFIICAEGFSALISKFVGDGRLTGCKVARSAPVISHMLFADDSYLFCKSSMEEVIHVGELLHFYQLASGQQINLAKSSVFFSTNTRAETRQNICSELNIPEAGPLSMYLGLPNTLGRNKSVVLGFLKDKMRKRIAQWEGRFLSKAGKEILIKTVTQALPSYAMSVFLLPLGLCREMEMLMCKYWWHSSSSTGRGIHWRKWDSLTMHKVKGGMGLRDLHDFNRSLLCKQGWRLLINPNSLVSRLFQARYFRNGNYLTAELGPNPSYIWRSLWEVKSLVKNGARCRVGNGETIFITSDPWVFDKENPWVTSVHPGLNGQRVSSLMHVGRLEWDEELVQDLFNDRDMRCILSIPLSPNRPLDRWFWSLEPSGFFTVKSCYKNLQVQKNGDGTDLDKQFWKVLWKVRVPPKVKDLIWRASTGCLPTNFQLRSRHVEVDPFCPLCQTERETIMHALVRCNRVWECWERLGLRLVRSESEIFASWLRDCIAGLTDEQKAKVFMLCWAVWRRRNDFVWRNSRSNTYGVLFLAESSLLAWGHAQDKEIAPLPNFLSPEDGRLAWVKPPFGVLKINVDAAFFSEAATYSFAGIVRDHEGNLVEAFSVEVETDSLLVVQALRSSMSMASYFGVVIDDCKALWKDLVSVSICFVKRSANEAANALAKASSFIAERTLLKEDISSSVLDVILKDNC